VVLPIGTSIFRYSAGVDVADATEDADELARELAPEELPDDALMYTLPSRYCLPDVLGDEAWARSVRGRAAVQVQRSAIRVIATSDIPVRQLDAWSDVRGRRTHSGLIHSILPTLKAAGNSRSDGRIQPGHPIGDILRAWI